MNVYVRLSHIIEITYLLSYLLKWKRWRASDVCSFSLTISMSSYCLLLNVSSR